LLKKAGDDTTGFMSFLKEIIKKSQVVGYPAYCGTLKGISLTSYIISDITLPKFDDLRLRIDSSDNPRNIPEDVIFL